MSEARVSEHEFQLLRKVVYRQTGISLGSSKRALVEARLRGRLRELGLPSFLAYYRYLRNPDAAKVELQRLVDCITTNTTSFFRELGHFQFLAQEVLPAWRRRTAQHGVGRLRLWSAGCSTGQEAYSLAAVVHATVGNDPQVDAKILATDISSRALATASMGRYPAREVVIPPAFGSSFAISGSGEQRYLGVVSEARARVVIRPLNLLAPSYPFKGRFDVIFCCNVLIYFDAATRRMLVERLSRCLVTGGYLFLGLSEGLEQIPQGMIAAGPSIYCRCGAEEPIPGATTHG